MDSNRRRSFPLQGIISRSSHDEDDLITVLEPSVYPLTEENLAIHTKSFPPCKEARRSHARLFVENQRPVVEMELMLEQQRELEISSFIPISNNINMNNETILNNNEEFKQQQQKKKKRNWLYRLTHWIRLDKKSEKRRYHHYSWSAGMEEKEINHNASTLICQKRDSGISLFHLKRRSSSIRKSMIPTIAPPSPPPPPPVKEEEELIAFKYPKMVRKPTVDSSSFITPQTTTVAAAAM